MDPIPTDVSKTNDPDVPEDGLSEATEVPSLEEEGRLPPSEEGHTVLVVDDEALILEVVVKELTQAGYKVISAVDGVQALRLIYTGTDWGSSGVPDLIIADIMMPGMDGFEFCQRVKANPKLKPVPFLFLSAKRPIQDRARAFLLGGQHYIVKPFSKRALLKAVNERLVDAQQTQALLAKHEQSFEGDLSEHAVLSLLDLFLTGGWTGALTVNSQNKEGRIEFGSGEITNVRWDKKEGEEALAGLLAQVEGTFKVSRSPSPPD